MGRTKNINIDQQERSYLACNGLSHGEPYYVPHQAIDNRYSLFIDAIDDTIYQIEYALSRFALLDSDMKNGIRNNLKNNNILTLSEIKQELEKMKLYG